MVLTAGGQRVGVIGYTTTDTPELSHAGKTYSSKSQGKVGLIVYFDIIILIFSNIDWFYRNIIICDIVYI